MRLFLAFFLNLVSCLSFTVHGQEIGEIIKLHENNLKELYQSRGVPEDWLVTGIVDERDLISSLNEYSENVGLLIYSHKEDSLVMTLINKNGQILTKQVYFPKDSLVEQVSKANQWFSGYFLARSPSKRGAEIIALGEEKSDLEAAFEIVNLTLLPFRNTLETFNHLIIVPTLNVSILPFAAFKVSENKYLIDIMSYSIAPSLFELMAYRQMNVNRGIQANDKTFYSFSNALFVANPKFPKESIWNFPDLPGTLKEVDYITNSMDRSSFVTFKGEKATVSNIKDKICEYDLLYFATHGISDEISPLVNSFLVLADDPNGKSFLTAKDIQDIRHNCSLKADLAVLSACQTGLGKEHAGGIIGLARAFQIAGANHVLMSLWSINDEETAILMSFFFDFLKRSSHMMPHEAMRKAILKYKTEIKNNPNYWAAFSIFGIPY